MTGCQAETGFTLASAFHGRGQVTKAVGLILEHLFVLRGPRRVSAECDPRNIDSARLLERLGSRRGGGAPGQHVAAGEWADDLLFGSTAVDYRPARG
ncbi:RimJ/RimL family protein N-acetyltransferase [Actinoalloteichus hoggarensis]|uniref:Uncharacterized protein n=1 Tax=Actinoalloteichus hoggarensis TaxID=1470176 RepID=A0A221W433_9PSEU|nr:GNAT family protein [Actinoalloteichus hoggarensis]ASO20419.1 hypothetical protein AHOG_13880 [Actinoalloteichus hoggarensis]MBB5923458.1 RimJ/RimL family protein N-acetyltransferase [Actinoalloteichus hoggarensis]